MGERHRSEGRARTARRDDYRSLVPEGLDSPNNACRVARDEGDRELGFVWIGILPDARAGACIPVDMYVHEAHRGRGIARAMLERT